MLCEIFFFFFFFFSKLGYISFGIFELYCTSALNWLSTPLFSRYQPVQKMSSFLIESDSVRVMNK